jgi:acyl carrier protein
MPKQDFDVIKKEIKQLVAKLAELPEESLKDDAKFSEDLGIDSMVALEIIASIEKKYKVVVPEEDIPKLRSLQDTYNLFQKLLNK